ncbi:MAG TPA: cysteine--tRNA ligase [Candidatus Nanoarchaeia archaeon]|nr:cysteine--tRNA ligase [Candidatus Nanoarchaeia archaeon]
MKLFNTASKKLEELKPIKTGQVSLYTCGPTVYDYAHIGNLRNAVFNDTLRRVIKLAGYKLNHVMNVTDVGHLVSDADEGEDKLETGAEREGKTVWEVAEFYTKKYVEDTERLNVLPPGKFIKATDRIADQIELVKLLIDKGYAYKTKQAIYFDVTKLDDYGKLSGQSLDEKLQGARDEVVTDSAKKHPFDFAVWFFTVGHFKDHTMHWPSPWGEGFPGWHTECSAIIHATLGEPIDIHTGGIDHIGTHHTNEIAQSEAAYGKELAHIWLHNEFLLVDGQKMSKSLGNLYTLEQLEEKGYSAMALKILMLQAHYRSELNFTWQSLRAAENTYKGINSFFSRLAGLENLPSGSSSDITTLVSTSTEEFDNRLLNDLDTPGGLAVMFKTIKEVEKFGAENLKSDDAAGLLEFFAHVREVLGITAKINIELAAKTQAEANVIIEASQLTNKQKSLVEQRERARQDKDFEGADKLRKQLLAQGIELEDTADGPRWRRINPRVDG